MKVRKVLRKHLRRAGAGVDVAGDLNAVVAANVNEPGTSRVSSRQRTRIVQRGGHTEVFRDDETHTEGGPDERA